MKLAAMAWVMVAAVLMMNQGWRWWNQAAVYDPRRRWSRVGGLYNWIGFSRPQQRKVKGMSSCFTSETITESTRQAIAFVCVSSAHYGYIVDLGIWVHGGFSQHVLLLTTGTAPYWTTATQKKALLEWNRHHTTHTVNLPNLCEEQPTEPDKAWADKTKQDIQQSQIK